jgi:hypothetical protein
MGLVSILLCHTCRNLMRFNGVYGGALDDFVITTIGDAAATGGVWELLANFKFSEKSGGRTLAGNRDSV